MSMMSTTKCATAPPSTSAPFAHPHSRRSTLRTTLSTRSAHSRASLCRTSTTRHPHALRSRSRLSRVSRVHRLFRSLHAHRRLTPLVHPLPLVLHRPRRERQPRVRQSLVCAVEPARRARRARRRRYHASAVSKYARTSSASTRGERYAAKDGTKAIDVTRWRPVRAGRAVSTSALWWV